MATTAPTPTPGRVTATVRSRNTGQSAAPQPPVNMVFWTDEIPSAVDIYEFSHGRQMICVGGHKAIQYRLIERRSPDAPQPTYSPQNTNISALLASHVNNPQNKAAAGGKTTAGGISIGALSSPYSPMPEMLFAGKLLSATERLPTQAYNIKASPDPFGTLQMAVGMDSGVLIDLLNSLGENRITIDWAAKELCEWKNANMLMCMGKDGSNAAASSSKLMMHDLRTPVSLTNATIINQFHNKASSSKMLVRDISASHLDSNYVSVVLSSAASKQAISSSRVVLLDVRKANSTVNADGGSDTARLGAAEVCEETLKDGKTASCLKFRSTATTSSYLYTTRHYNCGDQRIDKLAIGLEKGIMFRELRNGMLCHVGGGSVGDYHGANPSSTTTASSVVNEFPTRGASASVGPYSSPSPSSCPNQQYYNALFAHHPETRFPTRRIRWRPIFDDYLATSYGLSSQADMWHSSFPSSPVVALRHHTDDIRDFCWIDHRHIITTGKDKMIRVTDIGDPHDTYWYGKFSGRNVVGDLVIGGSSVVEMSHKALLSSILAGPVLTKETIHRLEERESNKKNHDGIVAVGGQGDNEMGAAMPPLPHAILATLVGEKEAPVAPDASTPLVKAAPAPTNNIAASTTCASSGDTAVSLPPAAVVMNTPHTPTSSSVSAATKGNNTAAHSAPASTAKLPKDAAVPPPATPAPSSTPVVENNNKGGGVLYRIRRKLFDKPSSSSSSAAANNNNNSGGTATTAEQQQAASSSSSAKAANSGAMVRSTPTNKNSLPMAAATAAPATLPISPNTATVLLSTPNAAMSSTSSSSINNKNSKAPAAAPAALQQVFPSVPAAIASESTPPLTPPPATASATSVGTATTVIIKDVLAEPLKTLVQALVPTQLVAVELPTPPSLSEPAVDDPVIGSDGGVGYRKRMKMSNGGGAFSSASAVHAGPLSQIFSVCSNETVSMLLRRADTNQKEQERQSKHAATAAAPASGATVKATTDTNSSAVETPAAMSGQTPKQDSLLRQTLGFGCPSSGGGGGKDDDIYDHSIGVNPPSHSTTTKTTVPQGSASNRLAPTAVASSSQSSSQGSSGGKQQQQSHNTIGGAVASTASLSAPSAAMVFALTLLSHIAWDQIELNKLKLMKPSSSSSSNDVAGCEQQQRVIDSHMSRSVATTATWFGILNLARAATRYGPLLASLKAHILRSIEEMCDRGDFVSCVVLYFSVILFEKISGESVCSSSSAADDPACPYVLGNCAGTEPIPHVVPCDFSQGPQWRCRGIEWVDAASSYFRSQRHYVDDRELLAIGQMLLPDAPIFSHVLVEYLANNRLECGYCQLNLMTDEDPAAAVAATTLVAHPPANVDDAANRQSEAAGGVANTVAISPSASNNVNASSAVNGGGDGSPQPAAIASSAATPMFLGGTSAIRGGTHNPAGKSHLRCGCRDASTSIAAATCVTSQQTTKSSAHICAICCEVVEGVFHWFPNCGHGAHPSHLEQWVRRAKGKEVRCPRCAMVILASREQRQKVVSYY